MIVLGDFNIDYLGKKNSITTKLHKWEKDLFLPQVIKESTRICKTNSICIDLIFTDIRHIRQTGTVELHLSDHKPIFMIKKKSRNEAHPKKLQTRGTPLQFRSYQMLTILISNRFGILK